jgi:uncharacterized cupredoxin-like copper-binding protein
MAAAVGALCLAGAACGNDDGGGSGSGSGAGETVKVTATDTECKPEKTTLPAGPLTFEVENKGAKTTELYVYGEGDKVISEVENIGPGTSRRLKVELGTGSYELACKPGQTGNGIRVPIEVSGEGASSRDAGDAAAYDREVDIEAVDYSFTLPDPAIKVGEAIEFKMHNGGTVDHEFHVLDASGAMVGGVHETKPGATGEAVVRFEKAGTYQYICDVDDHRSRGMKGSFLVAA